MLFDDLREQRLFAVAVAVERTGSRHQTLAHRRHFALVDVEGCSYVGSVRIGMVGLGRDVIRLEHRRARQLDLR
jgi:hypothetical protein